MLFSALASENEGVRSMLNDRHDPQKYMNNLLKVVIYFEEFNYESIVDTPTYEVRRS